MKIHFVMHESFESPGAIETWARERKSQISYTRLYLGDTFPVEINFDFLVVMGGPQSPATTIAECSYFDSGQEISFIKKAIGAEKIVFGVCLGAQMIGQALGADFDHSPNKEIGVFEIRLTEAGKIDLIFSHFPESFLVGHWHGDMPGLTPEAQVLAFSAGCPRQIVRYLPNVYGFQCHFEFTPEAMEGMIQNSTAELVADQDLPYVENQDCLREYDFQEMNQLLFIFLDQLSTTVSR